MRCEVIGAWSLAQRRAWTVPAALLVVLAACDSNTQAPADAGAESTSATESILAPVMPAPTVTRASWVPDALEELVAPIALYPDALLGQILAASVNSQEVLDAGNWLLENPDLQGKALDEATLKAGFGPAMRSLVHFRSVVDMMCQQIDWTRQLGSAFTTDQKSVLDAVQRLRAQAAMRGNLESTPQQIVETKKENDEVYIEVKPADPQIVYVPTYNPQTVYVEDDEDYYYEDGYLVGGYYSCYCYPYWGVGYLYYGNRPFYPPAYVYRPIYRPGFRPAFRYAVHQGYRHGYNQGNNVAYHNNYFVRFEGNKNLTHRTESPLQRPAAAQNRPGQSAEGRYAGRPDAATQERLSQAAGARPGADRRDQGYQTRDLEQRVDRGYARSTFESDMNRDTYHDLGVSRPPPQLLSDLPEVPDQYRNPDRSVPNVADRSPARDGTLASQRDGSMVAQRDGSMVAQRDMSSGAAYDRGPVPSQRDAAFSGASQNRGSFDRAASARGHASMGSRGGRGGGGRGR